MACLVRRNKEGKVVGVFNKKGENITNQLFDTVVGRLKQTGLAKDVVVLSNDDLQKKLQEIQSGNVRYSAFDDELQKIKEQAIADGTFMKAPNGQPTNLTEKQWLQVRTTRFKEWFGDWENNPENASKVIDENGEPLVVYHGSAENITTFDEDWGGTSTANNDHGAFYFSDNKEVAEDYGREAIIRKLEGSNRKTLIDTWGLTEEQADMIEEDGLEIFADDNLVVHEVFLNMRNPMIDESQAGKVLDTQKTQRQVRFVKHKEDGNVEFIYDYLEINQEDVEYYDDEIKERAEEDGISYDEAKEIVLEEYGIYPELRDLDGVIIKDVQDDIGYASQQYQDEYIVIDPNQIKSATENVGSFSQFNDDIRYSKRNLTPLQVKHKRLLNRLKRRFPNVKILNEQEYQQKLRNEAGVELSNDTVVYGVKFSDGSIYLNDKFLDLETPIHEFSHIWEVVYPEKWNALLDEFRDTKGFKQALKDIQDNDLYKNLPLNEQESEALNTLIGIKGATYFKGNTLQRFLDKVKDFLRSVLHKLGVLHLSKEDLFEINVNRVVRDIIGGQPKIVKNGVVTNMDKVYESLYNLIPNVEHAESRALPLGQEIKFSGKVDNQYDTSDFYNKAVKELFNNKSFDELKREEKWDIAFLKKTGINPKKFKNAEELHFFVESEVNRLEKEVENGKYIMQDFTSADAQALYESYLKTGNADAGMMREAINDEYMRKELLKQTQDNQRNSFKAQLNHFREDGLPVGLQYILLNEILRKDFRVESDITIDGRTGKLSSYVKYLESQGKTETEIENLIEQYNAEGKITKKYVSYKRKPNTINTFFEVDFGAVMDIVGEGYLYRNVIGKVNDIDIKNVGAKVDLTRFGKYKVKELSNGYVLYKFPKGDENAIPLIQAYSSATKQLMDSMPWCTNGDNKARSVIENGDVFVVLTQTGEPRIQVTYNSDGSIEELGGIGANQSVRVQDSPLIDEIKEFIPNIESEQNRIKRDQLLYQLKIGNKINKEDFKWLLEKADRSSTYENVTTEYQEFLDNLDRETVAEYYGVEPDEVVIGDINILENDDIYELKKIKDVELVIGNVDIWFKGSFTLSLKKVLGNIAVKGENGGTLNLNKLESVNRLQIYSFDTININKLQSVYEIRMNGVSTEVNANSLEKIEYQLYSEYKNKLNAEKLTEINYIKLHHQSKINTPSLLKAKTLYIYNDSRISTEQLKSVDYLNLHGVLPVDLSNLEYTKNIEIRNSKKVILGNKLKEVYLLRFENYSGDFQHNINKISGWLKLSDSNFEKSSNTFDNVYVENVEIDNTLLRLDNVKNLKYLTLFGGAKLRSENLENVESFYVYSAKTDIDVPKLNNVKELVFDVQRNELEDINLQLNNLRVDTLLLNEVHGVNLQGIKSIQRLRGLSSYKTLTTHDTTYIGEMSLQGGTLESNGLENIGRLEVGLFGRIKAPKLSNIKSLYLTPHNSVKFVVSENLPQRIKDNLITHTSSVEFVKDNNIKYQKPKNQNVKILPNGFVYDGVVYLNKDLMTLDTPIHEFGHLWIDFIKEKNSVLYQQGIELVKKEGKFYVDKVLETQPELEGNALYEEALAEMIGDSGANIVAENIGWLEKFWDFIKSMFGISKTTDISNMTLAEFTDAIAKELLSGQEKTTQEVAKDVVNFQKVKAESQTFDTIATTPNIDSETALEVYKNVFSQEFISRFGDWISSNKIKGILDEGGEPKVFYRTSDNTAFDNYEDALKHSQGGDISVGFISSNDLIEVENDEFFNTANNDTVVFGNKVKINNNDDFIGVLDISASTDTNTVEGFVNNSIKNGKLKGKKVLVDDNYYYQSQGELKSLSTFNAQLVLEDFYNYDIKTTHQIKEYFDGLIEIKEKELKDNEVLLTDDNGISKKMTDTELWNEIQQGKLDYYKKTYSGFMSIFYKLWRKFNNIYKNNISTPKRVLSEEDLRLKLLNILNDLGVSTITISEYIEKYNQRQGQDPDIRALSDISNKLIAYANGEISIEDLTEETVHFIVEALGNEFDISDILDEVVKTDAWEKYSQQYYNKYMQFYSGVELYNIVRKEVLGKIIKDNLVSKIGEETNKSIIVKIKELINKFFDIIRGRYNENVKSKLDDVVNEITDRILNDEMSVMLDKTKLADSGFVMYSLNDKRSLASILKFKQTLEKRLTQLKRSKDAYSGKLQNDLTRLSDAINKQDEWYAIKSIVASVEPQVKQINSVLAQYRNKVKQGETQGTYFSQDEKKAFTIIKNDYLPLLQEIRAIISTYDKNDIPENIDKTAELSRLDSLISLITQVEGYDSIQAKEDVKSILKSIVSYYQLTPEEEALLESEIEKEFKDISWFQANFGSLEHTNNIFLNLLGRIITDGNNRAHLKSLRDISPFLKKIEKMGLKIDDFRDLLEHDEKGNHTKYFMSAYKFYKFEQEELKAKVDAYNKVFGKNFTVDQYKDANKKGYIKSKSDFTYEELKGYNSIMSDWYDENTERRYTKEFYEQRKQMFEQLGISEETKTFLQSLSTRRYFIMSKYLKNGKSLDYSELTDFDLQQLLALSQERKSAKSLIDAETGLEKEGVDKTISEDLQKLDEYYQEQNKDKESKIKQQFFDTLKHIEQTKGSKEAFKWLQLNGGIIFNDNFWNQFDNNKKNYIDLLRDGLEVLKTTDEYLANEYETYVGEIEDLMKRKREILKQYQMPNNPSEMNFDLMSTNTIENIKNIEQRLSELFKKVNTVTKLVEIDETVGEEVNTENSLNEAYHKALKDSGKGELDFLKGHLLDSDRVYLEELILRLNKIKNGSNYIDSKFKKYLEKHFGITDISTDEIRELINEFGVEQIAISYGHSKVMPYFKRFAPAGYENFINDMLGGKVSVYDTVKDIVSGTGQGITKYLGINTYFSWLDDTSGNDSYLNPNYDPNFEGGIRQPKLSKYANDDYFDKFGIDKGEYLRTKEIKPTRNIEMFNILNDMLDIKRKALESYNESGTENLYKIPQVSKGVYERLKDSFKGGVGTTISNTVKDIFYNRVDELAYGEKFEGKDLTDEDTRVIPKYYLRDLEEDSDVATELPHTLAMLLHSAYTYEERLNTVTDVMRLEQKLLDSKFVGKRSESTRAYKMFKDFVDGYFYGKQISKKFTVSVAGKEIDLSRLAIVFDRFVRTMNIGFSLPIAFTAYTTERIFLKIEEIIGEHVNNNSANWASKEWKKLTPSYLNDVAKIHKENKLYQLMEKFRLHDISQRTKSAGFNRIARAFNDVAYKFLEATNYPNLSRVLLTVLDDYRLVGDKIMTYNEFRKSNTEFIGKTNKEIVKMWNKYREKSVYNMMESVDGRMEWKPEYVEQLGEEYLEGQYQRIQSKVMRVNSNVDAVVPQEDKSAATRDYLMNFMTAHRGWLAITIQRKFKGRHFNFQTGQFEEGHYITFSRYLQKLFDFKNGKTFKNLLTTIKEEYNTLDDTEQQNIRRVVAELGVYMLFLGFGIIVAALADDDKNKDLWSLQFASYIYFRTTSEIGSVQAPSGVVGLIDVAQSPFIALNSIKNILNVSDYSLEPIKQGAYKGHSKLYRKVMKLWWGRHYYKLKNIKKTSDYYRFANIETLITMRKKSKNKGDK